MPIDNYAKLKEKYATDKRVVVNQGKGSQGIKIGSKMIIMFYKGDLLIKFKPERVDELVRKGQGKIFDPGTGKPMKDRVLIPWSKSRIWIKLCEEAIKCHFKQS